MAEKHKGLSCLSKNVFFDGNTKLLESDLGI